MKDKGQAIERKEYFKFVDGFCMYPEEYLSYGFVVYISEDGVLYRLN